MKVEIQIVNGCIPIIKDGVCCIIPIDNPGADSKVHADILTDIIQTAYDEGLNDGEADIRKKFKQLMGL